MTEPNSAPENENAPAPKPTTSIKRILVVTLVASVVLALAGWFLMPMYYDQQNTREVDELNAWLRGEGPPPETNNLLFTPEEMDKIREDYRKEQEQQQ